MHIYELGSLTSLWFIYFMINVNAVAGIRY